MEEKKKVSKKTAIIIIITIIILVILYFLFFVVDIVNYIKNYDYLQDAGQRADAADISYSCCPCGRMQRSKKSATRLRLSCTCRHTTPRPG